MKVGYIWKAVDGRWPQHPKIAEATLRILCDTLVKEGLIENFAITHQQEFSPHGELPNILELRQFFGNPADVNEAAHEVTELFRMKRPSGSQGYYYIARVVSSGKSDRHGNSLEHILRCYEEMHDVNFLLIPAQQEPAVAAA